MDKVIVPEDCEHFKALVAGAVGDDTRIIAAVVHDDAITVVSNRFKTRTINFDVFYPEPGSVSPQPDFTNIRIIDYGTAIAFGDYEACVDAFF